jgi:hypothetical protein
VRVRSKIVPAVTDVRREQARGICGDKQAMHPAHFS